MVAWLWGSLIVGTAVLLAILGMLLVRRSVTLAVLESHNDIAGFIYAVLGVVYAVLLAFVVIAVWEKHEATAVTVEQEANALADLFRNARAFPGEVTRLQAHIRSYAQLVIEQEWRTMAGGEASSQAWEAFNQLWHAYLQVEPQTAYENAWYAESLSRLDELGDYRRLRLLSSRSAVPGIIWAVLLIGGAITVAYSYFFGVRSVWLQTLMIASLSGLVALTLFLVLALEHPFRGIVHLEPEAFWQLMDIFDRWAH